LTARSTEPKSRMFGVDDDMGLLHFNFAEIFSVMKQEGVECIQVEYFLIKIEAKPAVEILVEGIYHNSIIIFFQYILDVVLYLLEIVIKGAVIFLEVSD